MLKRISASGLGIKFILCLGILLAIVGTDLTPLQEWDESQHGINALQMLRTGDFSNYRHALTYDDFNTKPPLFLWLTAGAFRLFGVSLFSLRLVSLVSFCVLLVVASRWLMRRAGGSLAALTLACLITCSGVLGTHVATTGDTDMLFVLFACVYAVALLELSIPLMGLAALAAFWTKGLALALLLPLTVYWLWVKRAEFLRSLREAKYFALALAAAWGVSLFILSRLGTEVPHSSGAGSLLGAMFLNDGATRFTDSSFEVGYQWDFLPVVLDIRFGPYIYVLYATLLYVLVNGKWRKLPRFLDRRPRLHFSLALSLSVMLVLLLSTNKHQWYVAPAIPFLCYVAAVVLRKIWRNYIWVRFALPVAFLVLYGFRFFGFTDTAPIDYKGLESLNNAEAVYLPERVPQGELFRILMVRPDVKMRPANNGIGKGMETLRLPSGHEIFYR